MLVINGTESELLFLTSVNHLVAPLVTLIEQYYIGLKELAPISQEQSHTAECWLQLIYFLFKSPIPYQLEELTDVITAVFVPFPITFLLPLRALRHYE